MKVKLTAEFLLVLIFWIHESREGIVLTQTPEVLAVPLGETVTIRCQSSSPISPWLDWYQQKRGEAPKLLIYKATGLQPGVSDRFSGGGSDSDFNLTIRGAEADDDADYYCQQSNNWPLIFGKGTQLRIKRGEDAAPSVFIFPPSQKQIKEGSVTLICMINGFYPEDAQVIWKADGSVTTKDVANSQNMLDTDSTYSWSSILTLSKAEWESHDMYSCEVKHKALSSPLIKTVNRRESS